MSDKPDRCPLCGGMKMETPVGVGLFPPPHDMYVDCFDCQLNGKLWPAVQALKDRIAELEDDAECYEGMKEGVTVRVTDLEQENQSLRDRVAELEGERDGVARAIEEYGAIIQRLTEYRESCEDAFGKLTYAYEPILDEHFNESGELKGDGKWRLREIWSRVKTVDECVLKFIELLNDRQSQPQAGASHDE